MIMLKYQMSQGNNMDKKHRNKTYEIDMIGMLAKDIIVDNNIPQFPVNIDGNN